MEGNLIDLNDKFDKISDKPLLETVSKLENIINEINNDEALVNKIKDIITIMNTFIKDFKKNSEELTKYIENLNIEHKKQINKLQKEKENKIDININNNEIQEKIFSSKSGGINKGKYIGHLIDGKREGRGIIKWDNGDLYNGEWKNDKKEGKGIYCYNNGQRYEGDWYEDKKEGRGIYYWNNGEFQGDRYEGEWRDDNYEGKGIYYYNDGSKYEGDFKKGKREGKGVYYYSNGDREMGDYLDNNEIGTHVVLKANGKIDSNTY